MMPGPTEARRYGVLGADLDYRVVEILLQGKEEGLREQLAYQACIDLALLRTTALAARVGHQNISLVERAIARLLRKPELLLSVQHKRGFYLGYERWLSRETDGCYEKLHLGRSRNDLNATIASMRAAGELADIWRALSLTQLAVLRKAEGEQGGILPYFTHYQPALPVTFSHQLMAYYHALQRVALKVQAMVEIFMRFPLGAGAGGGASIDTGADEAKALLGFKASFENSIDAVANRDLHRELLGVCVDVTVIVSRISRDFLTLISGPSPLASLPDSLLGSSSMMPQKKKPFCIGAFAIVSGPGHRCAGGGAQRQQRYSLCKFHRSGHRGREGNARSLSQGNRMP